jgi:phage FluMu gp28-like protein
MIQEIKEGGNPMGWSLHSVTLENAVEEGLVERINGKSGGRSDEKRDAPRVPGELELASRDIRHSSRLEFLARIRRECIDEEQWLQEYCCVPADEQTAFITFEMIAGCEAPGLRLLSFEELAEYCQTGVLPQGHAPCSVGGEEALSHQSANPISHQSSLFVGVDVARKHDLCVIDVGEKIGDVVWDRMRIEMQNAAFAQMEAELYRLLRLREVKRLCIDATGMGTQLAERARQKFGWKVEPVNFTSAVKEELAFGLRADFEEKRVRMVRDEKLAADLRSVRKEVTASGNLRFDGRADQSHSDRFWAKALRQHAARQAPKVRAVVG